MDDGWMVRLTHADNDMLLRANKDRNGDFHREHEKSRVLLKSLGMIDSYDELRGDELIAPGALVITKLERKVHGKITGFETSKIEYPVVVPTDGVELEYCLGDASEDENSKIVDFEIFTPPVKSLGSSREIHHKLEELLENCARSGRAKIDECIAQVLEKLRSLDASGLNLENVSSILDRGRDSAYKACIGSAEIGNILSKIAPRAMSGKIYIHKSGEVNIPSSFFNDKNKLLGERCDAVSGDCVVLNESFGEKAGVYKINKPFPDKFPYKFKVTNETLRLFCWSSGITEKEYISRFGRNISPMMGACLLVDPLLHYSDCLRSESEAQARKSLGLDSSAPLSRIQLYLGSSMCSTDQIVVPVNGTELDIYVAPSCRLRMMKNSDADEVFSINFFYLMIVDPVSRKPFIGGTFKTMEKYRLQQ